MYPVLIFWMDEKRVSSVRKGQFFQMPQLMVCHVILQKIPYVRLGQALTLSRCILLHKNQYGFSEAEGWRIWTLLLSSTLLKKAGIN